MRGESRLCKGSIEPLLKLPDGALATRRIVLFRCVAAAAARCASVRLKRRAAQQLCRLTRPAPGVFLSVSRCARVTQK